MSGEAGTVAVNRTGSTSESARFGHQVDRITVSAEWATQLSPQELATAVLHEVNNSRARTIILRYPSEAVTLGRVLPTTGRAVHPGGTVIYWEASTAGATHQPTVRGHIAPVAQDTLDSVLAVIADSFRDYSNHYRANPLIKETAAAEGYPEWAATTMVRPGNRLFTVASEGETAAVATVDTAGGAGPWDILLAGTAERHQGRGHYLRLIRGILHAASDSGQEHVAISTQSQNIAVQRAWVKLGFAPTRAIDTVHLVAR